MEKDQLIQSARGRIKESHKIQRCQDEKRVFRGSVLPEVVRRQALRCLSTGFLSSTQSTLLWFNNHKSLPVSVYKTPHSPLHQSVIETRRAPSSSFFISRPTEFLPRCSLMRTRVRARLTGEHGGD